jgi:hydrogenase nickel incorporation protein HypA/HybF
MHELGIAQSIIDIVKQHVPEDQAWAVRSIKLRLGKLSGVVADSLEFSFTAIVAGTPLQSSTLAIEHVPIVLECGTCRLRFEMEDFAFTCPSCSGTDLKLISGTDMQVVEIELDDKDFNSL